MLSISPAQACTEEEIAEANQEAAEAEHEAAGDGDPGRFGE
jgi:hypothetical protein